MASRLFRGGKQGGAAKSAQPSKALIQRSEFYFVFETRDDIAEFLEVERFANDLVDCQFLVCPDVFGREMGRKDNDSSVIVAFSKFPYQVQPAGARHPVIADYDVEFLLCDLGERVMAIFGYNDFSMWRLQCVGDGRPNGWFVVNCENMEFLFHARTCALREQVFGLTPTVLVSF